jgi:D-alanyl-D-alanine carboxypeptidase
MQRKITTLVAVAALLVATPVPASAAPGHSALKQALDQVTAAGMPGAIAANRTRSAASGIADVTDGRPMRAGFRHRAGSITKTFVATAILQVVGEGRIDLDAPVSRYVPQ